MVMFIFGEYKTFFWGPVLSVSPRGADGDRVVRTIQCAVASPWNRFLHFLPNIKTCTGRQGGHQSVTRHTTQPNFFRWCKTEKWAKISFQVAMSLCFSRRNAPIDFGKINDTQRISPAPRGVAFFFRCFCLNEMCPKTIFHPKMYHPTLPLNFFFLMFLCHALVLVTGSPEHPLIFFSSLPFAQKSTLELGCIVPIFANHLVLVWAKTKVVGHKK